MSILEGVGLDVSRETLERLDSYVQLLLRWQTTINLISPATRNQIWQRHILDSAQVAPLFPTLKHWIDLGSGAGLPALVIAMIRMEKQTDFHIRLLESNLKKCAFLREAIRTSATPAVVVPGRIENILKMPMTPTPQVITARALAPMAQLMNLCEPLFQQQAKAVFLKGADAELELTEARKSWNIDAELVPSVTESEGRLVVIHSAAKRLD